MLKYLLHIGRILETFIKYRKNIKGWDVVIKKSRIKYNDNLYYSKSLIINSTLHNDITILRKSSIINSEILGYNKIGANTGITNSLIGKFTYIGNYSQLNNVNIGNYCSIASYFKVGLGKHPTNFISTSPFFYSKTQHWNLSIITKYPFSEDNIVQTVVGHDVWIGENVIVMDGIKIGNGAILAAGSVVTKDVPDYAIVGGIPAKLIKYRFSEDIIFYLQNLKWWEKNIDWIKNNIESFQKPVEDIQTPFDN
jgi:acetyltransferase-like isoleucine patch superfamily enzyme